MSLAQHVARLQRVTHSPIDFGDGRRIRAPNRVDGTGAALGFIRDAAQLQPRDAFAGKIHFLDERLATIAEFVLILDLLAPSLVELELSIGMCNLSNPRNYQEFWNTITKCKRLARLKLNLNALSSRHAVVLCEAVEAMRVDKERTQPLRLLVKFNVACAPEVWTCGLRLFEHTTERPIDESDFG